jgi:zinc protease
MKPRSLSPSPSSILLAAAVIAGCLAAPSFAAASNPGTTELPDLPFEFYKLDNGLGVILLEDHSTPIVGVNIWYHVGSKNERPGRSGFAHLFEHMMFQGSEHQDDEYFGPLQKVGAQMNGSTAEDRTNYWEVVPRNHLERALLMESDRMGWLLPALTQEKLDNQRDVVLNERRQGEGRPYSVFWMNFNEMAYPKGHPYDHSVIGSPQDLKAATLEDVKDFFRTYYTPNNATLSIAGDFDSEQTKAWIEEYFGEIPPGPPVEEMKVWVPEVTQERRVRLEDRVKLPRVYYVWHTAPAYHPGDAELSLSGQILGRDKTGRLYQRLVHDTELAQDVSVRQDGGQISSTFVVTITLRPGTTIAQVEKVLDEELDRFRKSGPTDAELSRAQNSYESGFLERLQRVGGWGGKNDLLNRYNHYVGTPDYLRQDLSRYLDATPATVQEAFSRWIGAGRIVFEVHPVGHLAPAPAATVDRSVLPAGGPDPQFKVPELAHASLDNGLRIVVMEQNELPLVQARILFGSGATADPPALAGLCSLSADMLLEGAAGKNAVEFADALERLGSELRVSTTQDYTVLTLSSLHQNLDASLGLAADAVLRASFPAEEFAQERDHRILDIERESDDPNTIAEKVTRRVIYGDSNPYGRLAGGTAESVEAITLAEVRAFASSHFTPGNATLVVVGQVTPDEVYDLAERHLGGWQGAAPARTACPPPLKRTQREVYLVDKPGDSQSTISIAEPGVARNDPDWETIAVANRVLGGYFSSRLNLNLREDKGYTYGARSAFDASRDEGDFRMSGRVQTEVTAPAITEFLREFDDIQGPRPITEKELEAARSSIVLEYPARFETISEMAGALVNQIVNQLPEDELSVYPQRIEAVDLDAANAAAREYFHPDETAVIVVGDLAKIEEPIRELGLGPIHHLDAEGRDLDEQQP